MHMMELQIATTSVKQAIPADKTLTERLRFAMRYVRDHERDLFWMSHSVTDDGKFRTAIAAVMLAGSDEDKDVLTRSMKPLQMLSAATRGIPVDWSAFAADEDLVPLMKLWQESESSS